MQTSYLLKSNATLNSNKLSAFVKNSAVAIALISSLFVNVSQASDAGLPEIKLTPEQMKALAIETDVVKSVSSYPSIEYVAQSIVPLNQRYAVTMPVDGQVLELLHFHGSVKKGDVIATIYSAELLKLQSAFIATLADYQSEISALNRAKKLSQTGAVSSKQRQQLEANVKKLAQTKSQQKLELISIGMDAKLVEQLESTQKLQSAELQIKAPVSGELFDVQVQLGQRLMMQDAVIFIATIDPIVIDVEVPIDQSKQIVDGQTISLTNTNLTGLVYHMADFVNPRTQSVEVHTRFDNPDFSIKPGQTFKLQFNFEQEAFKTHLGALTVVENQTIIFVKQLEKIKALAIKVLQTQNGLVYFTPLQAGILNEQTEVVVHGASSLKNSLMAEEGEE